MKVGDVARFQLDSTHLSPLVTSQELFALGGADPLQFLQAVEKYVDLHREMFGTYQGELFRRPTEEVINSASGTFEEWLNDNGLQPLLPVFISASKTLGYEYCLCVHRIVSLLVFLKFPLFQHPFPDGRPSRLHVLHPEQAGAGPPGGTVLLR